MPAGGWRSIRESASVKARTKWLIRSAFPDSMNRMKHWIMVVGLLACTHPIAAEDIFSLYNKLQDAWEKKDYTVAMQLADQIIQKSPGHSGIQYQYAKVLAANGKPEESMLVLERIAKMGGSPPVQNEPAFDSVKQNTRFQNVVHQFEQNKLARGQSEVAFRVPGKSLIPEGIAYDSVTKKFYIGSTYLRKIVVTDGSGKAEDFAHEKQDGLWGVLGLEVDAKRRYLWANCVNAADTIMKEPESATQGKTAIFKYDLRTGKLIKKYETGSKENPRLLNDLAISPNGDVYISESLSDEVYRIDASRDVLELFVEGASMSYPNGIAISDDGKFLYIAHLEGITVIDLSSRKRELLTGPPDAQLGGEDGFVYYRKSLLGIQTLTGGIERVARFHLDNPKHVKSVEVLQVNHPLFQQPTTGDIAGNDFFYIANSQFNSFDETGKILPDDKLKATVILKVVLNK
jgi:sugar lactone lactonase YvrE